MARNVSHNIESLEMDIHTITNQNGIVKKRYVDNRSGQMVLRVDEHDYCERIPTKTLQGISNNKFKYYGIAGDVQHIDAIIISIFVSIIKMYSWILKNKLVLGYKVQTLSR